MNAPGYGVTSDALLQRMAELHTRKIDLSLDRSFRLLADLGNPHHAVPGVVHIAGTNGKGSTLAMIRAGLEAAGEAVHTYTSPHLVRFHERIVLRGQDITEPALVDILSRTLAANGDQAITQFEATTCAAFLSYAETPADTLLLEVGLGGRADTTNVVADPRLCIITPVDMDHQSFLGETLAAIAGEKAGILKRRVPCIVAKQQEAALDVIEARAAALGVPLCVHGQHWHVAEERGLLVYQDERGLLDLPLPVLPGPHQIENAGTALAALRHLGHDEETCAAALARARWPARMQRLADGPLPALAPRGELWLDGGHNPHAARAMAETLRRRAAETGDARPLHLIFALQGARDARLVLAPFSALAERLTAVPVPDEPASQPTQALAAEAQALGIDADVASGVEAALRRIAAESPQARVLIFGSLYLAGAVLRLQEEGAD
ncbi:MAG: folylpolyglutamate synthase/dihydrofolate synthase family protein [Pseudomonadota bacterium]